MTNQEAINYLQQLYQNGGHCWLDEQRIEAIGMAVKALQEEPISEELIDVAKQYVKEHIIGIDKVTFSIATDMFVSGAKWQKAHNWKPADGDDLPEIDREVIALLDNGKVVFAHRPPGYWDGKDIVTGKVTRNYPKTYDKGGWNIQNVKYWLDCSMPKEIKL